MSEGHKYSIPSTTVWGTSPGHTEIRPPPSGCRGLNDHGETLRTVHSRSPSVRLYAHGKCFSNGVPATQGTVVFTESLFLLPAKDQLPSPQSPPFHPTPHADHRLDPWNLPCSLLCVVGESSLPCHREHLFPNWFSNWLLIGLWVRTGDSPVDRDKGDSDGSDLECLCSFLSRMQEGGDWVETGYSKFLISKLPIRHNTERIEI